MPHASLSAGSGPRNRTVASKSACRRRQGFDITDEIFFPKLVEGDGAGLGEGRGLSGFIEGGQGKPLGGI